MMKRLLPDVALVATLGLGACSEGHTTPVGIDESRAPAPGSDPIAAIAINGGFTQLVDALQYVDGELNTGLVDLFLNGKDQYTKIQPHGEDPNSNARTSPSR